MTTQSPETTTPPRSVLITGCSSGIGLTAARTLRRRGWRVIGTARKPADLERLAREEGIEVLPLELSDPASIAACAAAALELTGGRLTALYNNAATGLLGAVEDVPGDVLRRHLDIGVVGPQDLTRHIIPAMRANGTGRIIITSSVLGIVSGPYRGIYCAAKFALEAIGDAMRYELAGSGLSVSLLEPGPIRTQFLPTALDNFYAGIDMARSPHRARYEERIAIMTSGHREGDRRLGPEHVMPSVIHALESRWPRARYRISWQTKAAAIGKRILPGALLDRILMRM